MLDRAGGLIINPVSRQTADGCSVPGLRAGKACSAEASSRGRWIAESGQGHSCPPGSLGGQSSPSPSPPALRSKNRACEQLESSQPQAMLPVCLSTCFLFTLYHIGGYEPYRDPLLPLYAFFSCQWRWQFQSPAHPPPRSSAASPLE